MYILIFVGGFLLRNYSSFIIEKENAIHKCHSSSGTAISNKIMN